MPYRKFRSRTPRTRRFTRNRKSRRPMGRTTPATSKALGRPYYGPIRNFMPNSCVRKLKYVTAISMNPPTAGRSHHVFRANDLYDPDLTSVGHQPRGFDQLMAAYRSFTVIGSKITITQQTTVSAGNGYLMLTHSGDADPLSGELNDPSAFESTFLVNKPIILADASGASRKTRLGSQVSIKKYFKQKILGENDFAGSAASGPNKQSYWTVYYQNLNSGDPETQTFLIELEYIAVFRQPIQIGIS